MKPALVVMAAGIGSRYGGLKQIEPVGPGGEIVIDYSVFDALRAGFGRVLFIIRKEIEAPFRAIVDRHFSNRIPVDYVFQELEALPGGFRAPPERTKPWGTGHAILQCKGFIKEPFAVINADDFYGRRSFEILSRRLQRTDPASTDYSMVGYILHNTLSEHGSVARGLCEVDSSLKLLRIVERLKIERTSTGARMDVDGQWVPLSGKEWASMNMWGFTPALFDRLEEAFLRFLPGAIGQPKAEFLVPTVVGELVTRGDATVEVLASDETWLGVTYSEDKPGVVAGVQARIQAGDYPERLWS
jgi:UTP-glucose-1-phosphate uridylyltransferase